MSDWRIVNSSGHAERFTTAVGEAFFVQNERLIRMVTEYTAHADDEVRYRAVPYRPPGIDPSVSGSVNVDIGLSGENQFVDNDVAGSAYSVVLLQLGRVGPIGGANGEWHRVRTSQLNGLTDVAASDAPAAGNSLKFSDISGTSEVDVWLGKDADGNLYIAVGNDIDDPMPFAIAV